MLDKAYMILYIAAFVVFAILAIFCLIRAIIGPRVCDRLVAEIGRASCRERV